jgi:NAD(P)-dependent dehydrogenase (short-subunit alcohol dehydrogenase family)
MKIAVFGASGIIGTQVVEQLTAKGHEVLKIGARRGDHRVDYTDAAAVEALLESIAPLDAIVVSVGGDSAFKPYSTLTDADFLLGAERKLIAQFRIVRLAEKYLRDNGSVTLTSGFLSHYPNPYSLATGPFNAAIDTFVQQSAEHLPRGLRVNVVSPAPVVEPEQVREGVVSAAQVAEFFVKSVEGQAAGTVFQAWGGLTA